jgi:hypothetical protein
MCALLTGCPTVPIPQPSTDFSACVARLWEGLSNLASVRFSLLIRECALKANSCNELRRCALAGAQANVCAGRAMAGDKPAGFCDLDGRAISCWRGEPQWVRDCPRGGEQCAIVEGRPMCTLGACPPDIKEGSFVCSPNGQRIISCEKGKVASLDCGLFGLQCQTNAQGKAVCVPPTKACTGAAHHCEASTAVGCLDGREVRVSCDASRMACAQDSKDKNAVGVCSSALGGPDCPPRTPPRCAGDKIQYCVQGHVRQFMCKTFGFNKCVQAGDSVRCAM